MWCRGIRGATLVSANTKENILAATQELLQGMIEQNQLRKEQVACVFFTTTPDLDAEFPALAARQLGWRDVALLCSQEIDVPQSLPRCIRFLILFNTEKSTDDIVHLYIKGAEVLRQDQERQGGES